MELPITISKTVADWVAEDYRTADVFKRHGIDFCCGGKTSLETVCERKGISFDQMLMELEQSTQTGQVSHDYQNWEADRLIHHIMDVHHHYVNTNLDPIQQYADKVALVHGAHRPEVIRIRDLFRTLSEELRGHLKKEEEILFPYVIQMVAAKRLHSNLTPAFFQTVVNPLRVMEAEHDHAGQILAQIRQISNQFTPPDEACNTYRVLYSKLKEFESDLHTHIHLENNLLFPLAQKLEKSFPVA